MDNSSYNKFGLFAFVGSVSFCLVFFIYISFVEKGVDLKEIKAPEPAVEQTLSEADQEALKKPWVESELLVARGQKAYKQNCAICHGETGAGDAPAGMALVPPARNLIEGKWKVGGTSVALFKTLQNGIAGGSMASFKHLDVLDRWGLVQYVRSITQNKPKDNMAELEKFAQNSGLIGSMKLVALIGIVFVLAPAWGYDPDQKASQALSHEVPPEIQGVGIKENLGGNIDLDRKFTNHAGQTVSLGNYFGQGRPVLMAMIYYNCPNLCNFQLNGLVNVVNQMKGKAGIDYDVVAVSMDHKETPDLAAKKRQTYLKTIDQKDANKSWHFLVGTEENVKALADEFGFQFKWNDQLGQYAHAAATYVMSEVGQITRYLYGIEFSPQTLRLSLVEASKGLVGDVIDQFLLFCFQFNPAKNKYVLYAYNLMRVGGLMTVVALAAFLIPLWRRERRRMARGA